jgi:hypothetical protein
VPHCDVCAYWLHCDGHRRTDDRLSLVAGIRGSTCTSSSARASGRSTASQPLTACCRKHPVAEAGRRTRNTAIRRASRSRRGLVRCRRSSRCRPRPSEGWRASPSRHRATCSSTSRATASSVTAVSST